jgi:hypothetical protein
VRTDPAFGRPVARFRGGGRLEVRPAAGLGVNDITVAAWVNATANPMTVLGDVISWFDPGTRHGFTLGFQHGAPSASLSPSRGRTRLDRMLRRVISVEGHHATRA